MAHHSIRKVVDLPSKIKSVGLYQNAYKTVQHLQTKKINTAILTQTKSAGLYPNAYKTVQYLPVKKIFTGNSSFLVK